MHLSVVLFVSTALLIYFTLHAWAFFLLNRFFITQGGTARLILAVILFFLALCFIAAFILTHFGGFPGLRGFYYFSALWLGTLVNLLLIFTAGFLCFASLQLLGVAPERRTFGWWLLLFTAAYTAYGWIQAQRLEVQNISVSLPGIPASWKGKKIAHISDIHLGMINGERLTRKIVARLEELRPDMVFITGDLFDAVGDHLDEAVAPFQRLQVPIFSVIGNHETYLGLERVFSVLAGTRIRTLRDEIIEVAGMQILGLEYPERGRKKDISPLLKKGDPSRPIILLYHEPIRFAGMDAFPAVLQLSGHTHKGQLWPIPCFTRLIYKGLDYGLHREGNFFIYTTSGAGTWGPPLRIGSSAEMALITFR